MVNFDYIKNRTLLEDLDIQGKTVLLRVDFNVPLSERGDVLDDTRIMESLTTIRFLLEKRCKVILVSHLKRPKGWDNSKTLEPIAHRLQEMMQQEVFFLQDPIGSIELKKKIQELPTGSLILLENIRFYSEETSNATNFAKQLAELCDCFVNNAFGTMHRAHSSTVGVAQFVPSALGLLPQKELEYIDQLIYQSKPPLTVILGGGKTSTKIKLLEGMLNYADHILIGGGMVFTFLKAMGHSIGRSLYEAETLPVAQSILTKEKTARATLHFPVDIVCALELSENVATQNIDIQDGIPENMMGLDIGTKTQQSFAHILEEAQTIFWNGPMGVFEVKPFDVGTRCIANAIESVVKKNPTVMTLVGGGESAMAVRKYGIYNLVSHVSTGGGALLELLEGIKLPGIMAIPQKN